MMHRDLKSPNVLLSEEGVAKIADVGMVRPQVQELVTAQPIMTPLWAAPEVQPCPYPPMAALLPSKQFPIVPQTNSPSQCTFMTWLNGLFKILMSAVTYVNDDRQLHLPDAFQI